VNGVFPCVVDVAPIRAEPGDASEQVTQALRGEPLTVEESRDGWARVRTAYEYPGWIRQVALADAPGRVPRTWLPEPRPDGDPVDEARTYLGAPYLWGGMTEHGIDCSGLVHMSYRRLGRLVPRDADQQEAAGTPVRGAELRTGDLVTYGEADRTTHIAFWLGDNRILHSTERDDANGVVEEPEPDDLRQKRRRLVRF
jgi:hypothetical protein